jgi:hypothetical protein
MLEDTIISLLQDTPSLSLIAAAAALIFYRLKRIETIILEHPRGLISRTEALETQQELQHQTCLHNHQHLN